MESYFTLWRYNNSTRQCADMSHHQRQFLCTACAVKLC